MSSSGQYVVTAQKPSSISHVLVSSFTSALDKNLILSKSNRLEIHKIQNDGTILPVHDLPLYGTITFLCALSGNGKNGKDKENLFIATNIMTYCILEYDTSSSSIITLASGTLNENFLKNTTSSLATPKGIVDPSGKIAGKIKEVFDIRIDELRIIDLVFLHASEKEEDDTEIGHPLLSLLYDDYKSDRYIKSYRVNIKNHDLVQGTVRPLRVDSCCDTLLPVSFGGVLILGNTRIVYLTDTYRKKVNMDNNTLIQASCPIGKEGNRFLLGDQRGKLSILVLQKKATLDGNRVESMLVQVLGDCNIPKCLTSLENGIVFVGSVYGDSQLLQLHTAEVDTTGTFVEVLDTYMNLGPIVDFAMLDLEREGQGQMITCSGAFQNGSLRVIRNGIGVSEEARMEASGINGIWSLRSTFASPHDMYLVHSFVAETRILALTEEEMEEMDVPGFLATSATLCCHTMMGDTWLQVTEMEIRLVDAITKTLRWSLKPSERITVADANATQFIVALAGGILVSFVVTENGKSAKEVCRRTLMHEIACISIAPPRDTESDHPLGKALSTEHAAIGLWTQSTIHIVHFETLEDVTSSPLGADVLPRSVLFCTLQGISYLLVGLGDGHVVTYLWISKEPTPTLSHRKIVALGNTPIALSSFTTNQVEYVFAACDRPSVIYSINNAKLTFSNVNTSSVRWMCPFDSAHFPECLVMVSEEEVVIGTIDGIQKLHISTIPLKAWPRRIEYDAGSKSLLVAIIEYDETSGEEKNSLRLFDATSFDVLDSYALETMECCTSLCTLTVNKTNCNDIIDEASSYYFIGTAFSYEEEAEPQSGRILIIAVISGTLRLVSQVLTKGAVYCLTPFSFNQIVAGINSKTQLFTWKKSTETNDMELTSNCSHFGNTLVLFLRSDGHFILVGDLMKSMSLLLYNEQEDTLEEVSRDFNSQWMTALEMLSTDTFLGAESGENLFLLNQNEGASEEERVRLVTSGQYHIGEFINCFRKGSLVMINDSLSSDKTASLATSDATAPALTSPAVSPVLFVTVSGMVGVLLHLTCTQYKMFSAMQYGMAEVVHGVGGFSHREWRSFRNKQSTVPSTGFVDGDLIESFLELKEDTMEAVMLKSKEYFNQHFEIKVEEEETEMMWSVVEMTRCIEEMVQLH